MAQPSGCGRNLIICHDNKSAQKPSHSPYHPSASYTRRHSSSNAGDLESLASESFALPENFKDAHIESDNGKEIYCANFHLTAEDVGVVVEYFTDEVVEALVPSERLRRVILIKITVHFEKLLTQNVVIEDGEGEALLFGLLRHGDPFPLQDVSAVIVVDFVAIFLAVIFLILLILHFSADAQYDTILNFI